MSEVDLLGAHVSTAGGLELAPEPGAAIGAAAIQLFTTTPNQWPEPVVAETTATEFREAIARASIVVTVLGRAPARLFRAGESRRHSV